MAAPRKDYRREYPLFSLCGLNCAFCTMRLGGLCPGCGGGAGNQPCKFTRCARERDGIEYCWQCGEYPCEKYRSAADYDSFLSHQAMFRDAERAKRMGIAAYRREQERKLEILHKFLEGFNDGRKKTLFCTAAALLDLASLQNAMECLEREAGELSLKERAALAAGLLQKAAEEQKVSLKLRKKPKRT